MAVADRVGMMVAPSEGSISKHVLNVKVAPSEGSIDKTVKALYVYTGSAWEPAPFGILGDVDGDGEVTVADYTLIRYHIEGASLLTGNALLLADVNQDGVVDETDHDLVRDYILA